jgi:hypothetical protein
MTKQQIREIAKEIFEEPMSAGDYDYPEQERLYYLFTDKILDSLRSDIIDGHDITMILNKCRQLKGSDGEGWLIGNFIEKILLKEYD